MDRYVIYKEFGELRMTDEINYNAYIRNASRVINLCKFSSVDDVIHYLTTNWSLTADQIIDKTGGC